MMPGDPRRAVIAGLIALAAQTLGASCYLAHERCPGPERVPPGLPRAGFVGATVFESASAQTGVAASFYRRTWAEVQRTGLASECRVLVEEGGCIAHQCMATAFTPDDVGDIETAIDEVPLAGLRRADGPYATSVVGRPLAGQTLHVRAAGGADVPAFEGCVSFPDVVSTPLPTSVHVGVPLTLSWGASDAQQMIVALEGSGASIRCTVAASAGTLTVPTSITSLLVPGMVDLGIEARNERLVAAGSYEVHLAAGRGSAALVPVD